MPLLVLCVQEPELALKRVAASVLSDVAKHTPELAQVVVDAGAVSYLAPLLVNQDAKLKRQVVRGGGCGCFIALRQQRPSAFVHAAAAPAPSPAQCTHAQVCSALGQVAKHSVDLAEVVVEAEVFPKCLTCLKFPDEFVQKHAATLVREVVKHTPELAQLVVANGGGVGALVDYCGDSSGNNRCQARKADTLHCMGCSACMHAHWDSLAPGRCQCYAATTQTLPTRV